MLKLRFSKPIRRQYMDGKISLCKYECTVFDNEDKHVVSQFTVTGTAKCSPSDTVNQEFGIKLADSRAKLNGYRIAAKLIPEQILNDWVREINKKIASIEFIDYMRYLKKKEMEHIEDVCNEV